MNSAVFVIAVAFLLLAAELAFFLYCFRWLSSGKRLREREFARLDSERAELLELQAALMADLKNAKRLSEDTLGRLNRIGAEANAEWNEMIEKVESVVVEVEARTQKLMDGTLSQLHRHRLGLEKASKDGEIANAKLQETIAGARKILRLFDKSVPSEQIFKDLQTEKYAQAKKMLTDGVEATEVARKLSMSHSEVTLLSFMR